MGTYYKMVCHDCKCFYTPELLKAREIEINLHIAAAVGRFVARHARHSVQLMDTDSPYGFYDLCPDYRDDTDENNAENTKLDDNFPATRQSKENE